MTAEILDELAERAEQRDAIEAVARADDHALAAAVGEAGEGGLVGHPAREAERVDVRGLLGVVLDEPAAAERRAEPRIVDRDDRPQLRSLVELEVNFAEVVR